MADTTNAKAEAKANAPVEPEALPTAQAEKAEKAKEKRKVTGHRVSIIGKGVHVVGGSKLRRGQHYSLDSLKLDKNGLAALRKDPNVVVEPINSDNEVIVPKPGEDLEDEESE
jgi:hypothetical protein